MDYSEEAIFQTKNGVIFPGFLRAQLDTMFLELEDQYGLSAPQYCEAASYSMAMVVRYALGLSAEGGKVTGLIADTRAGWIALGTLRHLQNCGAAVHIVTFQAGSQSSPNFDLQLKPLLKGGAQVHDYQSNLGLVSGLLTSSHNIICGLYDSRVENKSNQGEIARTLNDLRTPIHCIECPVGLDVDSGDVGAEPLFASSTLSLGAPLAGLYRGHEYVGRHYLCDVSFAPQLYEQAGFDLSLLFAEQPVLQIYPKGQAPNNSTPKPD